MTRFAIRRLLLIPPVLLGVSLLVFWSVRMLPGDVAQVTLGAESTNERLSRLRAELGLDRPWHEQYLKWLWGAVRGDWGRSLRSEFRVGELVASKVPATVELGGAAFLLAAGFGIPLGFGAALGRGSWLERTVTALLNASASLPSFAAATLLILLFAVRLPLLPSSGYTTWQQDASRHVQYLILPAVALALGPFAALGRAAHAAMRETADSPWIAFAISKGLTPWAILLRHRVPIAIGPAVTLAGLQCGYLLAGSVLIETIFGWPGAGRLLASSIFERDYPVVQALVLLNCTVFLLCGLAADLAAAGIDPRLRRS